MRQRELRKRIADQFGARGVNGIRRDRKRQADHDHAAQALARDVDPFPEGRRPEQKGPRRFLKRLEQLAPLTVDSLAENEHLVEVDALLQRGVHVAQLPVRGEQRQRAPTHTPGYGGDQLLDRGVERFVLRHREVGRQAHQRLVVEVEGRRQDELLDLGAKADPRAEVIKGSADRQGRGREHGGTPLGVDAIPQQRAHIDRRGPQQQVFGSRHLAEPVHAVHIRLEQRLVQDAKRSLEAAADHLQLADALVRLIATQPLADTGDGPSERDVERGQGGGCVFGGLSNRTPTFLLPQPGRDADRFFSSLGLTQSSGDPLVGDAEELAHALRRGDGLGDRVAERVIGCAEMRLALQVSKQAVPESLEKSQQPWSVDLLTQAPRGRIFEVVRLVDHQVVVLRQQPTPHLRVRQQQRVVDDHDVGRLRLRSSAMHVAVLSRAVDADAVHRIARDAVPENFLATVQAQLRAITALGRVEPDQDLELEHQILGVPARLGEVAPPAPQ